MKGNLDLDEWRKSVLTREREIKTDIEHVRIYKSIPKGGVVDTHSH